MIEDVFWFARKFQLSFSELRGLHGRYQNSRSILLWDMEGTYPGSRMELLYHLTRFLDTDLDPEQLCMELFLHENAANIITQFFERIYGDIFAEEACGNAEILIKLLCIDKLRSMAFHRESRLANSAEEESRSAHWLPRHIPYDNSFDAFNPFSKSSLQTLGTYDVDFITSITQWHLEQVLYQFAERSNSCGSPTSQNTSGLVVSSTQSISWGDLLSYRELLILYENIAVSTYNGDIPLAEKKFPWESLGFCGYGGVYLNSQGVTYEEDHANVYDEESTFYNRSEIPDQTFAREDCLIVGFYTDVDTTQNCQARLMGWHTSSLETGRHILLREMRGFRDRAQTFVLPDTFLYNDDSKDCWLWSCASRENLRRAFAPQFLSEFSHEDALNENHTPEPTVCPHGNAYNIVSEGLQIQYHHRFLFYSTLCGSAEWLPYYAHALGDAFVDKESCAESGSDDSRGKTEISNPTLSHAITSDENESDAWSASSNCSLLYLRKKLRDEEEMILHHQKALHNRFSKLVPFFSVRGVLHAFSYNTGVWLANRPHEKNEDLKDEWCRVGEISSGNIESRFGMENCSTNFQRKDIGLSGLDLQTELFLQNSTWVTADDTDDRKVHSLEAYDFRKRQLQQYHDFDHVANDSQQLEATASWKRSIIHGIDVACVLSIVWPHERFFLLEQFQVLAPFCTKGFYILIASAQSHITTSVFRFLRRKINAAILAGRRLLAFGSAAPTYSPQALLRSVKIINLYPRIPADIWHNKRKSAIRNQQVNFLEKHHAAFLALDEGVDRDEGIERRNNLKSWYCFVESDVYFVPENLKRFLFSRGYDVEASARYVGLLFSYHAFSHGYITEPLQGGCFSRKGLWLYADFLRARLREQAIFNEEEGISRLGFLSMKNAQATQQACSVSPVWEWNQFGCDTNSAQKFRHSLETCNVHPFDPSVNQMYGHVFASCLRRSSIHMSAFDEMHDHYGRGYWAGSLGHMSSFVPTKHDVAHERKLWGFQNPDVFSGDSQEHSKHAWLLNSRYAVYWRCLSEQLHNSDPAKAGPPKSKICLGEMSNRAERGSQKEGSIELMPENFRSPLENVNLCSTYAVAYDWNTNSHEGILQRRARKKVFPLLVTYRIVRESQRSCPSELCGTSQPRVWGSEDKKELGGMHSSVDDSIGSECPQIKSTFLKCWHALPHIAKQIYRRVGSSQVFHALVSECALDYLSRSNVSRAASMWLLQTKLSGIDMCSTSSGLL